MLNNKYSYIRATKFVGPGESLVIMYYVRHTYIFNFSSTIFRPLSLMFS
jgi:hypothetical protein